MTSDSQGGLTTAYWDNFLNKSRSILGRDWERLDQVDKVLRAGGRPAIDILLDLIATAPRDSDGWLSYLLTGPIEELWSRSYADQFGLVEASAQSADLAEALTYLNAPSTIETERATPKSKRPSKRQDKRTRHP